MEQAYRLAVMLLKSTGSALRNGAMQQEGGAGIYACGNAFEKTGFNR